MTDDLTSEQLDGYAALAMGTSPIKMWPPELAVLVAMARRTLTAEARYDALATLGGLTQEERAAIDQMCYDEERKRAQGVLLSDAERKGPR